jgi:hypothetical protein
MKIDTNPAATMAAYLDPTVPRKDGGLAVPAVGDLRGKWIGFLENGWKSFATMSTRIEELMIRDCGIAGFRRYKISSSFAPPAALFEQVVQECDGAIVGLAN